MTTTQSNYGYIREVAKKVAGFTLDASKDYLIENRLNPIAAKHGFLSIEGLIQELKTKGSNSELERCVIEALTINETSFFRDNSVFEHLTKRVIPNLISTNSSTRKLNIWSNACSTGQEIYSIAILLRERFPQLENWNITLHASDISERVLEQARRGTYSDFELRRGMSEQLQKKYFEQLSEFDWKILPEISRGIRFTNLNLFKSWTGIGTYDIIMLRNVLIYFDIPEKRSILNKTKLHLNPGGYLFLGGSETAYNIDSDWVSDSDGGSSFRLQSNHLNRVFE